MSFPFCVSASISSVVSAMPVTFLEDLLISVTWKEGGREGGRERGVIVRIRREQEGKREGGREGRLLLTPNP